MSLFVTAVRKALVVHVLRNDDGQDLLEYALLAGLISLFAFGTIQIVGDTLNSVFWEAIASML